MLLGIFVRWQKPEDMAGRKMGAVGGYGNQIDRWDLAGTGHFEFACSAMFFMLSLPRSISNASGQALWFWSQSPA
jgi:hypothetical protein